VCRERSAVKEWWTALVVFASSRVTEVYGSPLTVSTTTLAGGMFPIAWPGERAPHGVVVGRWVPRRGGRDDCQGQLL
jgi:hypothetical protein